MARPLWEKRPSELPDLQRNMESQCLPFLARSLKMLPLVMKLESTLFSQSSVVTTLEEAMDPQTAQKNMESAVEQVFRVIRLKERNW